MTPLRALASDTARALQTVIDGLGLGWRVGLRSGDASNRERRQAREGRIDVLVTTPESLALLLSYPDTLPRGGCAAWWWTNGTNCWETSAASCCS